MVGYASVRDLLALQETDDPLHCRLVLAPGLPDGTSLTPEAGSDESLASDRISIHCVDAGFARSTNGPTNVSPARRRMVSPGAAASIAAWRSEKLQPLAHTVSVAADAPAAKKRTARDNKTHTTTRFTGTLLGDV